MFLLINKDDIYYLFNCYCCNPKGLVASRGYACIKSFKSIFELCEFIELLMAKIMVNDGQPSSFDIYSCKTINNIKKVDIEDELSFDDINYFIKQVPMVNIIKILNRNIQKIVAFINEIRLITKPVSYLRLVKDEKFNLLLNKFQLEYFCPLLYNNDFSCFYKSISIILFSRDDYWEKIKIVIAFILAENFDYFTELNEFFFKENGINKMCNDICVNYDILIQATAMLCQRPIFVFYNNFDRSTHSYQVFNNAENDKLRKCPLCVIQNIKSNYSEFIPLLNLKNSKDIYLTNFGYQNKFGFKLNSGFPAQVYNLK